MSEAGTSSPRNASAASLEANHAPTPLASLANPFGQNEITTALASGISPRKYSVRALKSFREVASVET
jgi:hypothetical protein